jgi:hypothetical protein
MDEEDIREPDQPFYDRLIDDFPSAPPTVSDYVDETSAEYANILQQSLEEYELQQKQTELELSELLEKEKAERLHNFVNVKKMCRRILPGSLEKEKSTLELLLYFIDLYETDYMDTIDVEPTIYNSIFAILESTRLSREDILLCKKFIIPLPIPTQL